MQIDLSGKHALVGASSKGLGKAIAIQLAHCGARVTLVARDKKTLQKNCSELSQINNVSHQYVLVDYYEFSNYKAKISSYIKENPVDILINNTPGPPPGGVSDLELHDYEQAFSLLFSTHIYTVDLVTEHMKAQGYGRIINVGSVTIKKPASTLVLSNSMRSALQSWSKSLANALACYGITVNTLLTGYFDTERLQRLVSARAETQTCGDIDTIREEMYAAVPTGRFGNPEEFAYLCAFLASPYAAYITGASIPIDGGLIDAL